MKREKKYIYENGFIKSLFLSSFLHYMRKFMVQKDPNIELCCSSSRKPPFCLAFLLIMRQIILLKGRAEKNLIYQIHRPMPWETCRQNYGIRTGSFVHPFTICLGTKKDKTYQRQILLNCDKTKILYIKHV